MCPLSPPLFACLLSFIILDLDRYGVVLLEKDRDDPQRCLDKRNFEGLHFMQNK